MTVYDPDTYHRDTFDPDAFPEGTTFSLRTVAKLLNDPSSFPVLDDPRSVANAELGREVLAAAGQASTAAKEKALAAVLAEIIATTELSDETRARIAELWQK